MEKLQKHEATTTRGHKATGHALFCNAWGSWMMIFDNETIKRLGYGCDGARVKPETVRAI